MGVLQWRPAPIVVLVLSAGVLLFITLFTSSHNDHQEMLDQLQSISVEVRHMQEAAARVAAEWDKTKRELEELRRRSSNSAERSAGISGPASVSKPASVAEAARVSQTTSSRTATTQTALVQASIDSGCYPAGTKSSSGTTCSCLAGWRGEMCDVPPSVRWDLSRLTRVARPADRPPVVNAVLFNREFDIFDIRMAELNDVVEHFIILESNYTFGGTNKRLFFNESKSLYTKYLPKITHIIIQELPSALKAQVESLLNMDAETLKARSQKKGLLLDAWQLEFYLRNSLGVMGLAQAGPLPDDALILLGDGDEIPSKHVVNFLKSYRGYDASVALHYRWSYYGFFWLNPRATIVNSVSRYSHLRDSFSNNLNDFRRQRQIRTAIGDGAVRAGWHCSWCLPVTDYANKLTSQHDGDGPRWGSDESKLKLEYLAENRKTGRWFDGSHDGKLSSPETEDLFAPQCVVDTPAYQYLVRP
eukprot:m.79775 g.79775  ORF g.79775 m.79775 type:complete len:474 (+) comp50669_c0_seq1:54-1475(+)